MFQPPPTRTTKGSPTRTSPEEVRAASPKEKGGREPGLPTTTPTRTRMVRTKKARTKARERSLIHCSRKPKRKECASFSKRISAKITVPGTPAPQAKPEAAAAKTSPKAAAVALVVAALTSGATASSEGPNCTLDVIGDTGAGEHLGCREAFVNQGVASNVVDQFCGTSSSHVAFETGGGKKRSNESIGVWAESLKTAANMFMLKSCPLVYSIGQFVMNQGYSFFWPTGEVPYLIPPIVEYKMEVDIDECRLADRVDHCVPIFKERVELISGMPAGPLVPLVPPGFIMSASESPGWSRFGGSLLHTAKNPKAKTFQVTEETSPIFRTTWLPITPGVVNIRPFGFLRFFTLLRFGFVFLRSFGF